MAITSKLHVVCEQSWGQINQIEPEEDIDGIAKLHKIT